MENPLNPFAILRRASKGRLKQPNYVAMRDFDTTAHLISRFFLADVAFTFLPLGVIAIMKSAVGQLDNGFLFDPEWSFAAIIIYGLAMTRVLELKVKYQRDRSERVFALARMCILGLIAAVVSLALAQMKAAGLPVISKGVLLMEFMVLTTGLGILFIAHWARELYVRQRKSLPAGLSVVRYLNFVGEDLKDARDEIDRLRGRMARRSTFDFQGPEERADYSEWVARRIRDIDFLIADMEHCVTALKQTRREWDPSTLPPVVSDEP
jgi:hypothetical protein